MNRISKFPALALFVLALYSTPLHAQAPSVAPTPEGAKKFIETAEQRLFDLGNKAGRASWVHDNFITFDTDAIAADANEEASTAATQYAKEAHGFDHVQLSPELARKRYLLELASGFPAPDDPKAEKELAQILSSLEGDYGKGKWCPDGANKPCLDVTAIEKLMATSRDPEELKRAWLGWHAVGAPMRQRYARMVELGDQGASQLGYSDVGALWRSNYDMPPDQFAAEMDRTWEQLRPLYLSLHAYVRGQLAKKYGKNVVPPNGPIPAHLLGNIWAQEWNNVYDLMDSPKPAQTFDLTSILVQRKTDAKGMVKYGEKFFISLGFAPLPESFWERSLFTKPADRDVVCHASAWDVDSKDDLRVKMCIQITEEDFRTIHHELGHNFYQRAYDTQPPLFQGSANDGFHEAVGDTIALSVTPEYLKQIGLIETVPPASGDIDYLLQQALEKVAFLPFGLLVDKWRWEVFSGQVKPDNFNKAWWDLRLKYQGVAPPDARTEADFDPGAKYHVPANVPYARYFLARIYQFQFQRALCKTAGFQGPLHRCSIYGNKAAGEKLNAMLSLGQSKPWPDALEALTGEKQMDASALADYFAPLKTWLDEQNKKNNYPVGW
ncbi:MAG TPA: M2 family metallopeptidase [Candidatus Acidoferrales bacterium]|jgi:peptidyl-dipeptidase A|nr:M2 family metallopeptidase [Candidatus Acidoferrales bacterium]